ncbi:MAG TPA: hypothetical protein DDX98_06025 [Bacteroidales bacterium]|nr:hypothetical protein [Bacteroidales bacterium]
MTRWIGKSEGNRKIQFSFVFPVAAIILLVLIPASLKSASLQNDTLIAYTNDFKFKEGVFLDFKNVIYNAPISKGRIITDVDYNSNEFFDKVLAKSKLYFIDNVGNKISVNTNKIWGYSRNGFLYIRVGNGYFRITLVGSCSHFIAYQTYEVSNNTYPYYNSYNYPYSTYSPSVSTQTEMVQYVLDFKTGRVLEYNVEGIEVILMNDPELHTEYMQLSNKKKKQLKFVYIRKYNQRNPLYLVKLK